MDVLCAIVDDLRTTIGDVLHFRYPHFGCVIHHGFNQYHRHRNEHAGPWHDVHEDAAVRVDMVDYRVLACCSDARTRGRCNHDVDGYSLRHELLLGCRWW